MTEKRFTYGETIDYNFFDVFEEKKYLGMIQRDSTKIVDRLNEQQEDLNYLAKFIGEFKVEEFKVKLRNLRMLEDKVLKQQDLLNEQKAIIEAKNEYQRTLEAKIRRLKDRIKVLEKNE